MRKLLVFILILESVIFAREKSSIYGFVREKPTGEPLSYVNIFLKETGLGAPTNADGYYVIPFVPPGEYEMVVSIIGYKTVTRQIVVRPGENYRYDFYLEVSPVTGEKITVIAEKEKFKESMRLGDFTFSMKSINRLPGFMESDVFRAIQHLPGVQFVTDYSAALYVRGGTPDQNLVMIDGIPIYNPFHLGAIFSTFNTDAIKEAEFIAGGFPVEYGGRIGSVINVIQREGNANKTKGSGNISLISSKVLLEGPFRISDNVRGTWMLGGRRTYFDQIFNAIFSVVNNVIRILDPSVQEDLLKFPYYFYDLNGKLILNIGDRHRLTFISFYGDDVFGSNVTEEIEWRDERDYDYSEDCGGMTWKWGNSAYGVTWRWIVNPRLTIKNYLYRSRFRFLIGIYGRSYEYYVTEEDTTELESEGSLKIQDFIIDNAFRSSFHWQLNSKHLLSGGFEIRHLKYNLGMSFRSYDRENSEIITDEQYRPLSILDRPLEWLFFIKDRWNINPLLKVQVGVKTAWNEIIDRTYWDPVVSFKYLLRENLALKLACGRYHQFMTTSNPPDESFRFLDIWFPVRKGYEAPMALHYVLGFEYLLRNNATLRIEGYYKDYKNLLDIKGESLRIEERESGIYIHPPDEFRRNRAYSYGIEFLLKKTAGRLQGWVGYSYSLVRKKPENSAWIFPKYDRRHKIDLVGFFNVFGDYFLSSTLAFYTGAPYTPILGRIENFEMNFSPGGGIDLWFDEIYLLGKKNSRRFPPYFRLDAGVSYKKDKIWGYYEWYLHIVNVTAHLNVMGYFYKTDYSERLGKDVVKRLPFPMFPFMPTFGVKFEF